MNFFKSLISFLFSREFFSGLLDRMQVLLLCIIVYLVLIVGFLYKPAYLFYLIVLGMVIMAGLMLYLLFPEIREKLHRINHKIITMINNYLGKS